MKKIQCLGERTVFWQFSMENDFSIRNEFVFHSLRQVMNHGHMDIL